MLPLPTPPLPHTKDIEEDAKEILSEQDNTTEGALLPYTHW
jgi:hypothetical protein